MWVTIDPSTITQDEKPLNGPHQFYSSKRIPWLQFCKRCGHMPLRNEVSILVTKIGCGFEHDQRFVSWSRRNWNRK